MKTSRRNIEGKNSSTFFSELAVEEKQHVSCFFEEGGRVSTWAFFPISSIQSNHQRGPLQGRRLRAYGQTLKDIAAIFVGDADKKSGKLLLARLRCPLQDTAYIVFGPHEGTSIKLPPLTVEH